MLFKGGKSDGMGRAARVDDSPAPPAAAPGFNAREADASGSDTLGTGNGQAVGSESGEGSASSISRYLAWIFLVMVLALAVFLSFMIGQNARDVVLQKQYAFSSLLADNLNHQIYRRFTLPTLVGFGRIALRQPVQYERLDQLIEQVIHGMNVQELNIYDTDGTVSYSTKVENLGRSDLVSETVKRAPETNDSIFDLDMKKTFWESFFTPNLDKGSVILRTTHPLRVEGPLSSVDDGPLMGVLEFKQDISKDMQSVLRFQWSIIGITLVSSLLIFSLMIFFLQRAERALAARVAEKERLQERLYQHEKLAGMGRVIAGIAHEIRNPLGIICSSTELLLRRGKDMDTGSRGILQATYDEAHRLSKTVTDFLDYARPQKPRQDEVDIFKVLEQAVTFMKPELDKHGISLIFGSRQEGLPKVRGDKDLLYRAVYNVLGNAVQAVAQKFPAGGQGQISLSLELSAPSLDPREPGEVSIAVRDNGGGFSLPDLSTYLDPFFTTKPGGSGLGLAIVNTIISSHRGRLELMNTGEGDERGAMVKIILPISER